MIKGTCCMTESISGRSNAAATTSSEVSAHPSRPPSRRKESAASHDDDSEGLTRERLRTHDRTEEDMENSTISSSSHGESADIFGDLGNDYLPWRRPSVPSAVKIPPHINSRVDGDDDLHKSVYESFNAREQLLQESYADTRFFMTESYLDSEISRYELQLREMRASSILKTTEEIDIKLKATQWDENHTGFSVDLARDRKISAIKVTWLLKSLKASEDFHMKSKLVRSMFRQTHLFYNTLNDMEIKFLTRKHLRDMGKKAMLRKLRATGQGDDDELLAQTEFIEISNQNELQNVEIRNLKELYVRMLQKESNGLDHHLDMLETLYNSLHRIYIDTMNMKIQGVHHWHTFRKRHDHNTQEEIRHIREQCVLEFTNSKEDERISELNTVRREAEEERLKRRQTYGDTSAVLSSELVFNMNLSQRHKLIVVDDTSSTGTFELDTEDLDEEIANATQNDTFLKIIRKRTERKNVLESRYNDMIQHAVTKREREEVVNLEVARKQEREFLKTAMRGYFRQEHTLQEKIKDFLRYEKQSIDALRSRHKSEVDSLINTHEIRLVRVYAEGVKTNLRVGELVRATSKLKIHQDDTMLTAHCFHEIRNVLASILCLCENLKEDPAALESIVAEQNDVCSYALDTMNDMLSIAKLKEPGFEPNRTAVNVSELFDAVIRIQGSRAVKGVEVKKLIDEPDMQIYSDKRLLLQVFVNLLSNAAKFTVQGTIALCCSRRRTSDGAQNQNLVIGIADTGPGFKISRHKSTSSNSSQDLSAVKGFVETHSEISANITEYHQNCGYKARNTGYGLYLASTVASALDTKLQVQSPVPRDSTMPCCEPHPGSFFYMLQPELSKHEDTRSAETRGRDEATVQRQKLTSRSVSAGEMPKICEVDTAKDIHETARERVVRDMNSSSDEAARWRFEPSGTMRFLIVDDQKLLRQSMIILAKKLAEQFPGLSIHVQTCACAEEALRLQLVDKNFDIISLDQYYDQIILSDTAKHNIDTYPFAVYHYGAVEQNKKAYIKFKNEEGFQILATDGALLGTDVIVDLRTTVSTPIVFSCTASDDVQGPHLMKPYTLESFSAFMVTNMRTFLAEQSIYLDGSDLRKSPSLVLYRL